MKLMSFKGRAVVVTAAASGIGNAAARLFASFGADLLLVDVNPAVRDAARAITGDGRVAAAEADLTTAAGAEHLARSCLAELGRIDVLINGVGGFDRRVATWEMAEEDWDRVVDLNLKSTFLCSKAVLPAMIAQRSGRIVNIASGSGRTMTHLTGSHYAAANAGLLGFTRHLAKEVGEYGITVNTMVPGITLTPRIDKLYDAKRKQELSATIPLGRLATPEDQAGAIVFLASDAAAYITGAALDVNGGRYMI